MAEVEIINHEDHNRAELNKLAADAGLTNAEKYPNKPAVANAINRVRAGEDPAAVDAELAPKPADDDKTAKKPARRLLRAQASRSTLSTAATRRASMRPATRSSIGTTSKPNHNT
jgi:hypothetical protein